MQAANSVAENHGLRIAISPELLHQRLMLVVGVAVQKFVFDVLQVYVGVLIDSLVYFGNFLPQVLSQCRRVGRAHESENRAVLLVELGSDDRREDRVHHRFL